MEENPYKAPREKGTAVAPQNVAPRQSAARRLVLFLLLACVGAIVTALIERLVFALLPPA